MFTHKIGSINGNFAVSLINDKCILTYGHSIFISFSIVASIIEIYYKRFEINVSVSSRIYKQEVCDTFILL